MSDSNRLARTVEVLDVDELVGGGDGAGGISGPPPSALMAGANVMSAPQSSSVAISLFIGLSPFLRLNEPDSIPLNGSDPASLFAHFTALRHRGEYTRALHFCDLILELLSPDDACSHLRQTNARAMALRDLLNYRSAYCVHAGARFLLAHTPDTYVGDHYHGLGVTLTELGEHVRAYKCLEGARHFHRDEPVKLAHTEVNTARLLTRIGKGREALDILGRVTEPALAVDAEIARAKAYEAQGELSSARRAIAHAFSLLADSDNEPARTEALAVHDRIEGRGK